VQRARPVWRTRNNLLEHFRWHGGKLGTLTVATYERSALATFRTGRRFTFTDLSSGEDRIGYFVRGTRKFLSLSPDEQYFVTHFRADDASYPKRLWRSTY